eukprot:3402495-Rhodomonas_salina.1
MRTIGATRLVCQPTRAIRAFGSCQPRHCTASIHLLQRRKRLHVDGGEMKYSASSLLAALVYWLSRAGPLEFLARTRASVRERRKTRVQSVMMMMMMVLYLELGLAA